MEFTFLGTGTSQGVPVIGCTCEVCTSDNPQDKRLRVSGLIRTGEEQLVIDCGPDFRQQMLRENIDDLDAVLITHEHNDHIIGMDDVRPLNFLHKKDMPVYALPRVGAELKQRFAYVFAENKYPGAPMVSLREISAETPFIVGSTEIIPISILHGELPIVGFRIGDFAYLTDVKTIPDSEFTKLTDLKVLVLSALHHREHHSHLTLEQAIKLGQKIKAEETYFTHFSHQMGLHNSIKEMLPEGFYPAYDGLTITF